VSELGKVPLHRYRGSVVVGYRALEAESCLGKSRYWVRAEVDITELTLGKAKGCDLARAGL